MRPEGLGALQRVPQLTGRSLYGAAPFFDRAMFSAALRLNTGVLRRFGPACTEVSLHNALIGAAYDT